MTSPLVQFLRHGEDPLASYGQEAWGWLVRDARRSNLLSSVATRLCGSREPMLGSIPISVRQHLENATRVGESSARSVRWEVRQIYQALNSAGISFMLLKGAAYEMAELAPRDGRLYVDVDIMVRKRELESAEIALTRAGWMSMKVDPYDQKYYREWMHEIPPLQHMYRKTSLDVHHTILPPTAKLHPDVELLWDDARELEGWPGLFVLSPCDMVLHSATHLFHDGDLEGGLRDLVDLDALLRQFSQDSEFWQHLILRAEVLGLERPLYYALRYTRDIILTPVPEEVLASIEKSGAPGLLVRAVMRPLIIRAMNPRRDNVDSSLTGFAKWLLYVRSHYLRMPLYLLVPHLVRKALKSD